MATATLPSQAHMDELFTRVHETFPNHLTPHGWYILAASALTTVSNPEAVGMLYKYLIGLPQFASKDQRRHLSRRLREQMLKQWVLSGIPRTIMAVLAIARAEDPAEADASLTRQGEQLDEANRERGIRFLKMLYGEDLPKIYQLWGAHAADFIWLSEHIIYGLCIGNDAVLNVVETELITYTSIACQNLGPTARIHLKALRRCNIAYEDVERITASAKVVAEWAGIDTSNWASISHVEGPPGGADQPPAAAAYDKSRYMGL